MDGNVEKEAVLAITNADGSHGLLVASLMLQTDHEEKFFDEFKDNVFRIRSIISSSIPGMGELEIQYGTAILIADGTFVSSAHTFQIPKGQEGFFNEQV